MREEKGHIGDEICHLGIHVRMAKGFTREDTACDWNTAWVGLDVLAASCMSGVYHQHTQVLRKVD